MNDSDPNSITDVLVRELDARLQDYVAAFSTKSATRTLAFYKPNALIRFRQYKGAASDSATTLRAFTGSLVGALVRRALPARLVLRLVFRRLANQDYDHSRLVLVGIAPPDASGHAVDVLLTFERVDRAGSVFESSSAVYRLERIDRAWFISEGNVFGSLNAPPPSLHVDRFQKLSTKS